MGKYSKTVEQNITWTWHENIPHCDEMQIANEISWGWIQKSKRTSQQEWKGQQFRQFWLLWETWCCPVGCHPKIDPQHVMESSFNQQVEQDERKMKNLTNLLHVPHPSCGMSQHMQICPPQTVHTSHKSYLMKNLWKLNPYFSGKRQKLPKPQKKRPAPKRKTLSRSKLIHV